MLNTSLQWCKMCAYMWNICSETCARCVGELREIWLIHSNFPWFSVDGQRSETSELDMDEFSVKCAKFA